MSNRKPADPSFVREQITANERKLATLQAERAALLVEMASAPDNEDLHRTVEGYGRNIQSVSMRITNLQGSLTEAGRQAAIARHAEHVKFLSSERERVTALGEELLTIGTDIIALAEKLGPLLQRYEQLATERGAAAWTVLREGSTLHTRQGIHGRASMREGALPLAIEAAFYHSGLGRVGPRMRVAIEPPVPAYAAIKAAGEWVNPPLMPALQTELKRSEDGVAAYLEHALTVAKGA